MNNNPGFFHHKTNKIFNAEILITISENNLECCLPCMVWPDQHTHTRKSFIDVSTGIRINDMFKKQQETDQSKTILLSSLGHFHAQMSLKILEKNMEICALFVKIPL